MPRPLVLLVDDHRDSLELYNYGLSNYGFDMCTCSNASEAFELSRTRLPDAIVTDLALPGMDGFALIRRLQEEARTRHIPILVISGHAGAATRAEVLAAGARAFFAKPCSVRVLEEALREVTAEASSVGAPDDAG
jgi:CheY-like chemotaxis protein